MLYIALIWRHSGSPSPYILQICSEDYRETIAAALKHLEEFRRITESDLKFNISYYEVDTERMTAEIINTVYDC